MEATTLTARVRRFNRLRALVIGDAMLDTYIEGTATRLCREGPAPIVSKTGERRAPGGAANVAVNLSALGADTHLIGVIGADATGASLREALQTRGVSDEWLLETSEAPTLHKMRILADGQYVVRLDEGDEVAYAPALRRRLLAHCEAAIEQCDLVIVSDYAYGIVADDLLDLLRERQPRPLVIDAKHLSRYRTVGASVITPNQSEALQTLAEVQACASNHQREASPIAQGRAMARRLLGAFDIEHAVVTLAEQGVYVASRSGEAIYVPARPIGQANDVGAGDSFAAALGLALAAGAPIADAARIGVEAAGIVVAKRGTAVVERRELLQRVSLYEQSNAPEVGDEDDAGVSGQRELMRFVARLERARRQGRVIVFTNGVFDILHAGHMRFLRQAKALGDLLVVGVNSDASARKLAGRRGTPLNSQRDRLALVAALDPVDHAVLFDEETPAELIRMLRPHLHVKGGDYADAPLPEAEAANEVGARIAFIPLAGDLDDDTILARLIGQPTGSEAAR